MKTDSPSLPDEIETADYSASTRRIADDSLVAARRMVPFAQQAAEELAITTEHEYALAVDDIRAFEGRAAALEARRMKITKPLDDAKKEVMELFRDPIEALRAAVQIMRKKVTGYTNEQREKAEKARREHEIAERAERSRLEKERALALARAAKLAKEGKDDKAQAMLDKRDSIDDHLERMDVAPLPTFRQPVAAGVSTRELWKHEVVSLKDLVLGAAAEIQNGEMRLLQYLAANEVEIGKTARALRGNTRIPGVRVFSQDSLAIRK